MQNLLSEQNLTDFECRFCLHAPIFLPAALTYTLISLPANCWVLWLMISPNVFWTDRMEVSEFHLVLTEIIFCLLGPPLMITRFYFNTEMTLIMIKIINGIFAARVLFQTSICVERYIAVVHPVLYLKYKLLRYRMSFCCFLWLQAILFIIVNLFFCSQITTRIYMSFFLSVFMINSFCSVSVLRALNRPAPGEGEREGFNLVKRKAFNIILSFQVIALVGYVPLIIVFYLAWNMMLNTLCIWQSLTYALIIWVGCFYPLFYLCRGRELEGKNFCTNCSKV